MKKSELAYLNSLHDIKDKIVIVTGSNSGVGFAICENLLFKGAHIVMACRDKVKAETAKNKLLEEFPNAKIEILLYDQSSIDGCKQFAKAVIEQYPNFYTLVLNAGMIGKKDEGLYENKVLKTIGVNFLSPYVILDALQDFLRATHKEHRILINGSLVATKAHYKKNQILKTNYGKFRKYNISKLGCLSIFKKYVFENKNPNVFYLYAEPGIASTGIIRGFSKGFQKIGYATMKWLLHSNNFAAMPFCHLICDYVANGDGCAPRGLLRIEHLPKDMNMKKYQGNNVILEDANRVLEEIDGIRRL